MHQTMSNTGGPISCRSAISDIGSPPMRARAPFAMPRVYMIALTEKHGGANGLENIAGIVEELCLRLPRLAACGMRAAQGRGRREARTRRAGGGANGERHPQYIYLPCGFVMQSHGPHILPTKKAGGGHVHKTSRLAILRCNSAILDPSGSAPTKIPCLAPSLTGQLNPDRGR